MQDKIYDVIVIGGGMAAAHAAWPLVEAGKEVLMLDGGTQSAVPSYDATRKDFESIRRTDEEQYRLFLGEEPAGVIAASRISHSSTTTSGNRSYISARTDTFLPLDLHGVQITQSLAKGGLSEAWGAVCAIFNERELEHAGIPAGVMHAHYQAVIDRIGISGVEPGYQTQPPAHITAAMRQVLARYEKLSPERRGDFKLHTSLLALLTEPLGEREPTSYQDLDFYMTRESAIYRARYTIEELERRENFHYLPGHIVQRVGGKENLHEVAAKDFSGKDAVFRARRVVLAAGAVNSNRILFQSDSSLPPAEFFLKPNYTLACFDPRLLGEADERERYSLCQLTLELPDASGADVIHANLYNYRSLLLWRLLQHAPYRGARRVAGRGREVDQAPLHRRAHPRARGALALGAFLLGARAGGCAVPRERGPVRDIAWRARPHHPGSKRRHCIPSAASEAEAVFALLGHNCAPHRASALGLKHPLRGRYLRRARRPSGGASRPLCGRFFRVACAAREVQRTYHHGECGSHWHRGSAKFLNFFQNEDVADGQKRHQGLQRPFYIFQNSEGEVGKEGPNPNASRCHIADEAEGAVIDQREVGK